MATDVTTQPRHSRRVQAWVYVIVNPLIMRLRQETSLLGEGNLTWRSYSKTCEYIRPIREYIESSQWPNYDDFVADQQNPGFRERFEGHDRQVSEVESTAARFFVDLTISNEFQKQVEDALEKYLSAARGNPQYPELPTVGDLPKVVGEYLVNKASDVPHHYQSRKFWEDYRSKFEHYRALPSFKDLDRVVAALQDTSKNLLADLEIHRRYLCVTYDIPAAPILVNKSFSADAYLD